MSKSKKRKPSFDLPRTPRRTPSAPVETTWVYRSDAAPASPPPVPGSVAATSHVEHGRAPKAIVVENPSLSRSVLKGTLFLFEMSLSIGEAVPNLAFDAFAGVAGYVPGSGAFVGILRLPVRANAAAAAAGRRLIHTLSGGTTSAAQ